MKIKTTFFAHPNEAVNFPVLIGTINGEFEIKVDSRTAAFMMADVMGMPGAHSIVFENESGDTESWCREDAGWVPIATVKPA